MPYRVGPALREALTMMKPGADAASVMATILRFAAADEVGPVTQQREVIDRMVAQPGDSDYGRLSVMLQARYDIEKLFDVPPESFDPPPRVVSAIVRMIPLGAERLKPKSELAFEQVVARAFGQRRKMLRRVLADWAPDVPWEALGILDTSRAEALSVAQFIGLADALYAAGRVGSGTIMAPVAESEASDSSDD